MARTPTRPCGSTEDLTQLRGRLAGPALSPGEAGYATACQSWNLSFAQQPALVGVAHTANDVVEAVRYATAHGLEIAVQATGQGVIREAAGNLLIVTAPMTTVRVGRRPPRRPG